MNNKHEDFRRRLDRFFEVCKRQGLRVTHQRLTVFEEVMRAGEHPDAETVCRAVRRRIPAISVDTVYRTLWLLKDLGLIATLGPSREKARFDADTRPHHHFVCRKCGKAVDLSASQFNGLSVPEEIEEVGRVETVHVELRGLCSDCLGP